MKKNKLKRRTLQIICTLLIVMLTVPAAYAYAPFDTETPASLEIHIGKDGKSVSGMEIRLYKVADIAISGSGDVVYTPSESFDQFLAIGTGTKTEAPVALTSAGKDEWAARAKTLETYVNKHNIAPGDENKKKTGADGNVKFENLGRSLYLVCAPAYRTWEGSKYKRYSIAPYLVSVPEFNNAADPWIYDVQRNPKVVEEEDLPVGGGGSYITLTAVKVWEDAGFEDERPASVTVELLRNGTVHSTATLSKSNNWRHTWTGLDDAYTWTLTEKYVSEDYVTTVDFDKKLFTVTNERIIEIIDPEPPLDPGDTPGEEDPSIEIDDGGVPKSDLPSGIDIPDDDVPLSDAQSDPTGKLPQTGQLWWPVPLLAAAGLGMFAAGWILRRKFDEDEK